MFAFVTRSASLDSISINLRRSRDCLRHSSGGWVVGWVGGLVEVFVCIIRSSLHSVRFGPLLRGAHKSIVSNESVHRKEQPTSGINTIP